MRLAIIAAAALLFVTGSIGLAQVGPAERKASASADPAPMAIRPPAAEARPTLDKADLDAWLDGVVPYALKDADMAGAVVVVVKDGQILTQKGYGYADVARKIPMDPARTLIRPGSTSKLFTWTAVMQLVEQGKLDLDRDINAYLDFKVPNRFDKPITLRDLMNHRGGFEEGLKDVLAVDPKGLQSTETYLKRHPRPQLFEPGTVPAYSNYGASLAGYIVERVSGEPFERYVERHIFRPLGMANSTFDQPLPARFQPNLSLGYRTASNPPFPYELIVTRPAGSMTATATDMAAFMIMHLQQGAYDGRQILNPRTTALMHLPTAKAPPGFAAMAHGFFRETRNGRTMIGHGGDSVVFHTELDLLPAEGVGIFYTFNSRGAGEGVYSARINLIDGFLDRYFPAPPDQAGAALATAKQDAGRIAGLYQSSRRVEHGFLSLFYLLQQTRITANEDGTITAPNLLGTPAVFREIAPDLWREVGGQRSLAVTEVKGVKTVIDSQDPTSVLQAVPFHRSATLNLFVMIASAAILVWTLVLWGLSPLLRWADRAESGVSAEVRRLRLLERAVAATAVLYLIAWFLVLQPILAVNLQVYSTAFDPVVRALQVGGLVMIAAAALAMWIAWRMFREGAPLASRIWSVALAAAALGIVWIGVVGRLMSFNLNY